MNIINKIMKYKYIFISILLFSLNANSSECFVMKDLESNKIIKNSNTSLCQTRSSPCSSFKIALSLIGFDSGVLKNEKEPEFEWRSEYYEGVKELHSQNHNPEKWMKNSCVWYSQEAITKKIGVEKFKKYVDQFNYGNKDLSGHRGKNDGLTRAWLGASLKISPLEQIDFLSKMIDKKLGVSENAYQMTKNITYIKDINGWKLHGKTGSCNHLKSDGTNDINRFYGWFIGWIEKGDKNIVFVKFMSDEKEVDANDYIGLRAKKIVIDELSKMNLDLL